jgi:hypothetical protein
VPINATYLWSMHSSWHYLRKDLPNLLHTIHKGCWQVLSPTRKETSYSDWRFWVSYILFIIIIGGILVLFICTTRLASNEIFSPSNKIYREGGRAKDLSALLYYCVARGDTLETVMNLFATNATTQRQNECNSFMAYYRTTTYHPIHIPKLQY